MAEPKGYELFGTIAMKSGLIRQPQLAKALAIQEGQKGTARKRIGEILVGMGALTLTDVRHILDVQTLMCEPDREVRFGLAAILNGFATHEQVGECLRIQRQSKPPRRIGEILVERGVITEQQKEALLRGLQRIEEKRVKPPSRLVQALRRLEEGGTRTTHAEVVLGAKLEDAEALIWGGVKSLVHLGILSHIIHRQAEAYRARDLSRALEEDRKEVDQALNDLVRLQILTREGSWLGERFHYTGETGIRKRVENLLALANDPQTREKIFTWLLQKDEE